MRYFSVLLLIGIAMRSASAQPVSFQLGGDVPIGQKPQLKISATERVSDIRLELVRSDGKHFSGRHPGLAKGQTVTLPIGDGAAGKTSYKGTLSMQVVGANAADRWTEDLTFDTIVRAPIKITYDADHLDLDKRVLQFQASRPAGKADLVVIGDDGNELGKGSATYKGEASGTWLSISWSQPANTRVMVMKLRVEAADGGATNVELVPWSVAIDHEDVNFSTNSAVIEGDENKKLDASLSKIEDVVKRGERFMKMKLYVAGHTDTVGDAAKNRKLSNDRALAIAQYFRRKGLKIPIAVAGFGQEVLKVHTERNVDERANRRADYVVGPAAGAPPFKGPYLKVKATWKQL